MSGRGKRGRPQKLTPQLQEQLVRWIESGNYIETSCALVGISKVSFYGWVQRGKKQQRGKYRDFLNAVRAARAAAETRLLAHIDIAAQRDWKAAAWRLEKMNPRRYYNRSWTEVSGKGGASLPSQSVIILPDNGRVPDASDK